MLVSEIISVLIFIGVIIAVYSAEAYLIFGFVRCKRKGISAKRFWSVGAIFVHLLAIAGIICFAYGHFIEPYRIEVKKVEIPTSKLHKGTVRVVQISDLHCEKKARNEKKVVELVNSMQPDIVVFTGDSINTSKGLSLFKETLRDINAPLGKFAVRGNFDTQLWPKIDLFSDIGFRELDANCVELQKNGEAFYISGMSSAHSEKLSNLRGAIPADSFSIFLYHYPDLVEDLQNVNVDLYLCGHTHGGQVALPFYGALITLSKFGKKYEAGMYTVGDTILYVNRGIGMDAGIAPRVRFFARPEITVFDIKPR